MAKKTQINWPADVLDEKEIIANDGKLREDNLVHMKCVVPSLMDIFLEYKPIKTMEFSSDHFQDQLLSQILDVANNNHTWKNWGLKH